MLINKVKFVVMLRDLWNNLPPSKIGSDQLAWPVAITEAWDSSPLATQETSEDDNLDTGNASPEVPAFPPFVESIAELVKAGDSHRRYVQPIEHHRERQLLATSVAKALQLLHMPFTADLDAHACLGYSATHVWEACCRTMITHVNDVIIVPVPTYTLLVPNILMSSGKPHYLNIGPSGKLSAEVLEECVMQLDESLLRDWGTSLPQTIPALVRSIEQVVGRSVRLDAVRDSRVIASAVVDSGVPKNRLDTKISMMLLALMELDEAESKKVIASRVFSRFLPPQVRGLLFLNPTLGGKFYGKKETTELAKCVQRLQLLVVEDLAYTLMADATVLSSMGRIGAHDAGAKFSITILGLSKPLGIANHRVGVAIGRNKQLIDDVDKFVRSSVGQVSTMYYSAVSAAFTNHNALAYYLKEAVDHPVHGYAKKLRVALAALTGTAAGSSGRTELAAMLPSSIGKQASSPAVQRFLKQGLDQWIKPVSEPEGGIFILADMTGAIRRLQELGYKKVNNTYELSIFLAFALRIRFIPEELTVSWDQDATHLTGTLGRLSFSPPSQRFVGFAWDLFVLLDDSKTEAIGNQPATQNDTSAPRRDLTLAEQSMFVEQMSRASAYTVIAPTLVTGRVSLVRLEAAIGVVASKMPSLSFTYPYDESGKPICVVSAPPAPVTLAEYTDENVRRFVEQPLELSSGRPLTAFGLFRRGRDDEHVLVLVQHHIVTDNTTMFRILDELFRAYGGLPSESAGNEPRRSATSEELAALPWINEADVQWHFERLRTLPIPFEYATPGSSTVHDFVFDVPSEQVKHLLHATAGRGTDFEVMMGIVAMALCATFPSNSAFGILMPASIRLSREALLVSGFAINSLVCAIPIDVNTPLSRVVESAAEAVRGCRSHISAPLPTVARKLRLDKKQVRLGDVALTVRAAAMDAARPLTIDGETTAWQQTYLPQIRLDGTLFKTAKHPLAVCFTKKTTARDSGYTCEITSSSELPEGAGGVFVEKLQLLFKLLSADVSASRLADQALGTPLAELSQSVGSMVIGLISTLDLKARAFVSTQPALQLTAGELLHRALRTAAVIQTNKWHVTGALLNKRSGMLLSTVVMLGAAIVGATYVPIVVEDDEDAALRQALQSVKCDGLFVDEWSQCASNKLVHNCRFSSDCIPQHTASLPMLNSKWRTDDDASAVIFPPRKNKPEVQALPHAVLQHHLGAWLGSIAAKKNAQKALLSPSALESAHHIFLILSAVAQNGTIVAVPEDGLTTVSGTISVVSSSARFVPKAKVLVVSGTGRDTPASFPTETELVYLCPAPHVGVALFSLGLHPAVTPNQRTLGTPQNAIDAIVLNASDDTVAPEGLVGLLHINTNSCFLPSIQLYSAGTQKYIDSGIRCKLESGVAIEPLTTVLAMPRGTLSGREQKVADLFAEILGISATSIARGTDFFDVGGNSFSVTQLASRVQALRTTDNSTSMAELINLIMRDLTVGGIAQLIRAGDAPNATSPVENRGASSPTDSSPKAAAADIDWENEIF